MEEKTVGAKEIAKLVGYSVQTVRVWAKRGYIPKIQAVEGGRFGFKPSEVLAALNKPKGQAPCG